MFLLVHTLLIFRPFSCSASSDNHNAVLICKCVISHSLHPVKNPMSCKTTRDVVSLRTFDQQSRQERMLWLL
ncbi:hypothetical protein ARMGADRAFT_751148 [Armillaria gallica]|uniref:Secreted protein n=1 Tax=Armillaria gallica TaxID=47427 RepID=A0A2H3DKW8_ARMGA|nr:hypothetical protein ARMGADRAFT_751148 [Armillaria gallica]